MNIQREKWFRAFVYWWLTGFIWAAFIQLFLPEMVAQHTIWGCNLGWQREIAGWNLGMIMVIISILRSKIPVTNTLVPGLCLLFAFFGLNHLFVALKYPDTHGYLIVILNFVPLVASALVLVFTRKYSKK